MEASKGQSIQHQIGELHKDPLRFGLNGVKSDLVGSHPLEVSYESVLTTQEVTKRKMLDSTYGSSFSLRMDMDRQILSRFKRPPGAIPSSTIGLEAMTGRLDNEFGFGEYLNDQLESFRPPNMHHAMEVELNISKGPICPSFI